MLINSCFEMRFKNFYRLLNKLDYVYNLNKWFESFHKQGLDLVNRKNNTKNEIEIADIVEEINTLCLIIEGVIEQISINKNIELRKEDLSDCSQSSEDGNNEKNEDDKIEEEAVISLVKNSIISSLTKTISDLTTLSLNGI